MSKKYSGEFVEYSKDPIIEHILKEYSCSPKTITEVAPWGSPHYFSIFALLCKDLKKYQAVDANGNYRIIRTMWERFAKLIKEDCPQITKNKFDAMLVSNNFKKITDWYFNTDEMSADLILLNSALYWSFPTLNLVKTLRDINPNGLIVIKDDQSFNEHTLTLLEKLKGLGFTFKTYLTQDSSGEVYFQEAKNNNNIVKWNKTLSDWLDDSHKRFFVILQNNGKKIPSSIQVKLTYEAWLAGLSEITRVDLHETKVLFQKFGLDYLINSLKAEKLEAEYLNLKDILLHNPVIQGI